MLSRNFLKLISCNAGRNAGINAGINAGLNAGNNTEINPGINTGITSGIFARTIIKTTMEALMQKHHLLPDVIQKVPDRRCDVFYKTSRMKANLGNIITPSKVIQEPCVTWISEVDKLYTLIMVNPDFPHRSKPIMKEFAHWVVGNIPGPYVEEGLPLVHYVGACPPWGTGLHRYIFCIYRQPDKINFEERCLTVKMGSARANFNVEKFVKKYGLKGPVGANYYLSEYDKSVDITLDIMGLKDKVCKPKKKNKKGY